MKLLVVLSVLLVGALAQDGPKVTDKVSANFLQCSKIVACYLFMLFLLRTLMDVRCVL